MKFVLNLVIFVLMINVDLVEVMIKFLMLLFVLIVLIVVLKFLIVVWLNLLIDLFCKLKWNFVILFESIWMVMVLLVWIMFDFFYFGGFLS